MKNFSLDLSKYYKILDSVNFIKLHGRVTKVIGLITESKGPGVKIGSLCDIHTHNKSLIKAEVVGFRDNRVLLMPLEEVRGIAPGSLVSTDDSEASVGVGEALMGRIIDGLGNPIDDKGKIDFETFYPIYSKSVVLTIYRDYKDRPL